MAAYPRPMFLRHDLYVAAPPEVVWQVTLALEDWPTWTPTVSSVERLDDGPVAVGSRARIRQPGLPRATWTVTDLRPAELFTWETRAAGMRMVATHELTPHAGGTRNLLRLELTGLPVSLLGFVIGPMCRRALAKENLGLKRHCERI